MELRRDSSLCVWAACKDPGGMGVIAPIVLGLERMGQLVTLFSNGKSSELLTQKEIHHYPYEDAGLLRAEHGNKMPDMLITSMCSDGGIGRELIPFFRDNGKPTVCVQDAWGARLDKEFADPIYWPDYILVPDYSGKEIVERTWRRYSGKIIVIGWIAFDSLVTVNVEEKRAAFKGRFSMDESLPVVYFAGQLNEEYTAGAFQEIINSLNKICAADYRSMYFIPRWHARVLKDAAEEHMRCLELMKTSIGSNVYVIDTNSIPYEELPIPDIIAAADVVVGMISTDLLKAAYLGKPVISVVCAEMQKAIGRVPEYPLAMSGSCLRVTSQDELQEQLLSLLFGESDAKNELRETRKKNLLCDGKSTQRAVNQILKILKNM